MWFFFSLAACAMALVPIIIHGRRTLRNPWLFSLGSFIFYAATVLDELFTIRRRAYGGDFGGIEDTIGAVLLITGALTIAVVLLNALSLGIWYIREK